MNEVNCTSILTKAVQCAPLIAPYVNFIYLFSHGVSYFGMEVSPHDNGYLPC